MKTFSACLAISITLLFLNGMNMVNGQEEPVRHLAPVPPMGWNSYDCFGATATESDIKANADYMSIYLKDFGWEYIVLDYCWYYPHPPGSTQDNPPQFRLKNEGAPVPWMPMDEWGRLLPDPGKFPSSAGGQGLKPLADYVHSKGLKFGIHVMRGIPRQAVWAKSAVLGINGITADQVADTTSTCQWLNLMYGVDMSKSGSQEYYNSIVKLYADWGVDFIKLDDAEHTSNHTYWKAEVEAFSRAIAGCGRPIVLSLSPGTSYENKDHLQKYSQMWRISGDFWDDWKKLKAQFSRCALWASMSGPGSWPDADMLPVGDLRQRGPFPPKGKSRFTDDEHYTLLTLWSIFRSPLMLGGNLPSTDDFLLKLITNPEIIEVNKKCYNSRELYNKNEEVVWIADAPGKDEKYVALFNTSDLPRSITFELKDAGMKNRYRVRDLWERKEIGAVKDRLKADIPPHGSKIYKLSL
ncbi:MAG: glycoside hydrolase family 27 protein [Bacteroidales bacterium]|nr:glycoside hydrolase family 27 protein [Bacteroidales bacterium]